MREIEQLQILAAWHGEQATRALKAELVAHADQHGKITVGGNVPA